MEWNVVELPRIGILGKAGFCTAEENQVQTLWNRMQADFCEIAHLGMREKDGSFVGFWGAMSDETMSFQPWTENFTRGYYLAGLEVYADTEVPKGWTKWILPARTWLTVEVDFDRYLETFREGLEVQIPARGLTLCGAVCDYTKPGNGKNYLFFPVK